MKQYKKKRLTYLIALSLFLIVFALYTLHKFSLSLFIHPSDRLQVLFYGQNTVLYSVGNADGVHYAIPLEPDVKMHVPGGYGLYRIGGLLKLSELSRDTEVFKRTFSLGISSFVPYIFYKNSGSIYYGSSSQESEIKMPTLYDYFFSKSNVAFFDKLYLFFHFLGKKTADFTEIDIKTKIIDNSYLFLDDLFARTYIGFFYQRKFREEKKSVQILYKYSYTTAQMISRVMEGNGIRVVDISKNGNIPKDCYIVESAQHGSSVTGKKLSEFFRCPLRKGKTEVSDIIVYLGDVEKNWEVVVTDL